jgi:hypothetical protein
VKWKGFGKKQSWAIQDTILAFAWKDSEEPQKTLMRMATDLAENGTGHLPSRGNLFGDWVITSCSLRVNLKLLGQE